MMRALHQSYRKTAFGLVAGGVTIVYSESLVQRAFCAAAAPVAQQNDKTHPIVYQYKICPFCNRVKSYLDHLKIPYETVEVNPLTKSELTFGKDIKKVPVTVINGAVIPESGDIIDAISQAVKDKSLISTIAIDQEFFPYDTLKWTEWSEKKLAVMLYPNITRSFDESWECFAYSNDVETWNFVHKLLVRTIGPAAMFMAHGKIKKKYGIVDERKELKAVLEEWCGALESSSGKFLHGNQLTMPDIQVFGVLRSIAGLRTFNEIMEENATLKKWYDNVDAVTPSCEVTTTLTGKRDN